MIGFQLAMTHRCWFPEWAKLQLANEPGHESDPKDRMTR